SAAEQGVEWADPDFFRMMPMPAVAGDLAHALDTPDSVVISRSIARKYFGRDTPVGETLLIDKQPMRVTAVLKDLPSSTHLTGEIFVAAGAASSPLQNPVFDGWFSNNVATYFQLKPGAAIASVEAQLPSFVQRHYDTDAANPAATPTKVTLSPVPIADIHLRRAAPNQFSKASADRGAVAAIAAVGALIVLVAAINFVTLMTARAARRAVEVGVRKAAGATRRDLIVQFMGEALVYVLLAGLAAMALAELLLPAFNALVQRRIAFDYLHDPALAVAITGVVLVLALLAGAYPALVLSAFRPASVLKGGPVQGAAGGRVRQLLVTVQFAVLIGLIVVAATIYRQTTFALNEGMRLDKTQVVLLFARPCGATLRDEVRALPGVREAACASIGALALGSNEAPATVAGRRVQVQIAPVDFGFFEVYHLRPLAGRLFRRDRPADGLGGTAETNAPLVINETAARRLGFASPAAAVGRVVVWPGVPDPAVPKPPLKPSRIIGVVPDFTFGSMRTEIGPTLYLVVPKVGPYDSIALNIRLDPRRVPETLAAIDKVWKRIGTGPMIQYSVDRFTLRLYVDTIVQGAMITASALIALSIACLGLFALSAYTTERRTKEIGIRKAMGASSSDILRLLLWQFSRPVLWANLIAWPAGWLVMTWWLKGFAYRVDLAPWTFAAATGGAIAIALATVFIHAQRVARAKPVGALRYE
ncbi:MAG: FtsX-like permease family protein, partial [Phenylobacterium sp.]